MLQASLVILEQKILNLIIKQARIPKEKQKNQNDNEKDKSITVNTRYKKFNSGDDYLNIKGNNQNKISLNHYFVEYMVFIE